MNRWTGLNRFLLMITAAMLLSGRTPAEELKNGIQSDDDGGRPLYLHFDDSIPFFRCFEDCLPAAWNGLY